MMNTLRKGLWAKVLGYFCSVLLWVQPITAIALSYNEGERLIILEEEQLSSKSISAITQYLHGAQREGEQWRIINKGDLSIGAKALEQLSTVAPLYNAGDLRCSLDGVEGPLAFGRISNFGTLSFSSKEIEVPYIEFLKLENKGDISFISRDQSPVTWHLEFLEGLINFGTFVSSDFMHIFNPKTLEGYVEAFGLILGGMQKIQAALKTFEGGIYVSSSHEQFEWQGIVDTLGTAVLDLVSGVREGAIGALFSAQGLRVRGGADLLFAKSSLSLQEIMQGYQGYNDDLPQIRQWPHSLFGEEGVDVFFTESEKSLTWNGQFETLGPLSINKRQADRPEIIAREVILGTASVLNNPIEINSLALTVNGVVQGLSLETNAKTTVLGHLLLDHVSTRSSRKGDQWKIFNKGTLHIGDLCQNRTAHITNEGTLRIFGKKLQPLLLQNNTGAVETNLPVESTYTIGGKIGGEIVSEEGITIDFPGEGQWSQRLKSPEITFKGRTVNFENALIEGAKVLLEISQFLVDPTSTIKGASLIIEGHTAQLDGNVEGNTLSVKSGNLNGSGILKGQTVSLEADRLTISGFRWDFYNLVLKSKGLLQLALGEVRGFLEVNANQIEILSPLRAQEGILLSADQPLSPGESFLNALVPIQSKESIELKSRRLSLGDLVEGRNITLETRDSSSPFDIRKEMVLRAEDLLSITSLSRVNIHGALSGKELFLRAPEVLINDQRHQFSGFGDRIYMKVETLYAPIPITVKDFVARTGLLIPHDIRTDHFDIEAWTAHFRDTILEAREASRLQAEHLFMDRTTLIAPLVTLEGFTGRAVHILKDINAREANIHAKAAITNLMGKVRVRDLLLEGKEVYQTGTLDTQKLETGEGLEKLNLQGRIITDQVDVLLKAKEMEVRDLKRRGGSSFGTLVFEGEKGDIQTDIMADNAKLFFGAVLKLHNAALQGQGTLEIVAKALEIEEVRAAFGDKIKIQGDIAKINGVLKAAEVIAEAEENLEIKGKIEAAQRVLLKAQQDLKVQGEITTEGLAELKARGVLTIDGVLEAMEVIADAGKDLHQKGTVRAAENIVLRAKEALRTKGNMSAGEKLEIEGGVSIDLEGSIKAASIIAKAEENLELRGRIEAAKEVLLKAQEDLKVQGEVETKGRAAFEAKGSLTVEGILEAMNVIMDAGKDLHQKGTIKTEGSIQARAGAGASFEGTVESRGKTTIKAEKDLDLNAVIKAAGFAAAAGGELRQRQKIESVQGVLLEALGNLESFAAIHAEGAVSTKAGGSLSLAEDIHAQSLEARAGKTLSQSGAVDTRGGVLMTAAEDLTTKGPITAQGTVSATAGGSIKIDALIQAANLIVDAGKGLEQGGEIKVAQNALLKAKESLLSKGLIDAGGAVGIEAGESVELDAVIKAAQVVAKAGKDLAQRGEIQAARDIVLDAGGDAKIAGNVRSTEGKAQITAKGFLSVLNSGVIEGQAIEMTGGRIDHQGKATAQESLLMKGKHGVQVGGVVDGGKRATLEAEEGSAEIQENGQVKARGVEVKARDKIDQRGHVEGDHIGMKADEVDNAGETIGQESVSIEGEKGVSVSGVVGGKGETNLKSKEGNVTVKEGAQLEGKTVGIEAKERADVLGNVTADDSLQIKARTGRVDGSKLQAQVAGVDFEDWEGGIKAVLDLANSMNKCNAVQVDAKKETLTVLEEMKLRSNLTLRLAAAYIDAPLSSGGHLGIETEEGIRVRSTIAAESLDLLAKKGDIDMENARLQTQGDLCMESKEGSIHGKTSTVDAGGDATLKAAKDIRLEAAKERVDLGGGNFEERLIPMSVKGGGRLVMDAGGDIGFLGVETSSGAGTSFKAGEAFTDNAIALDSHHQSRSRTEDRTTHQVSKHKTGGDFSIDARKVKVQAPAIDAATGFVRIHGVEGVESEDVHDTVKVREEKTRHHGFLGLQKTTETFSSQSSTSRGANMRGGKGFEAVSEFGDINLTNVKVTAPKKTLSAVNGVVRLLAGRNEYRHVKGKESSNPFWQSSYHETKRDKTYSETDLEDVEIHSRETVVEGIKGKVDDIIGKIDQHGGSIVTNLLEEVHKFDHNEQEGPTTLLCIVVAVAISMATAGAGSAAGGALAGSMGLTGTAGSVVAGMTSASITSLASQAGVTLLANKGDINKTIKALASSDTFKCVAMAAITGGIVAGVGSMAGPLQEGAGTVDKLKHAAGKTAAGVGGKMGVDMLSGRKLDSRQMIQDMFIGTVIGGISGALGGAGKAPGEDASFGERAWHTTQQELGQGAVGLIGDVAGGKPLDQSLEKRSMQALTNITTKTFVPDIEKRTEEVKNNIKKILPKGFEIPEDLTLKELGEILMDLQRGKSPERIILERGGKYVKKKAADHLDPMIERMRDEIKDRLPVGCNFPENLDLETLQQIKSNLIAGKNPREALGYAFK